MGNLCDFGVSVEEILETRELKPNEEVRFLVKQDRPTIFHFAVSEPSKITIDSWELEDESCSNTDIFVNVNDDSINKDNYKWKSVYGVDKIDIYPEDPNFAIGTFKVAYIT